ncbi:hypothetical protein [Micromonospora inositola]|uniref:Tryptophan-associated transmembrane protein (Trp_oprn_chp) n=1 Tax=Micromonospora inositola TaxID=47865 RepID=A0A1C5HX21_9ACTN|nr:hypothetical protein [Micromonospora inositola]SCG50615.1 hypothetical protein GA0070613_1946 [Micromonospora inositola]
MSQDLPIPRQDDRSDGTTVVEWGDEEPTPPGRVGRSLAGLRRDHRLPLVLAGLGAVAAIASLIGEWLVMTVPNGDSEGNTSIRVPGGVADVGGFGAGYLVGLLGLAVAVALALRGTPAVRSNARVAGLGLAVAVLAVLTATALSLDDAGQRTLFYPSEAGVRVDYGRGLVTAFLATVLLAAALHLSGQTAPAGAAAEPGAEPEPGPLGRGRRRERRRADDLLPAPADLTVEPTVPFARGEPPA